VWFVKGAVFKDVLAGLEWLTAVARGILRYMECVVVFANVGVA
jgi:hypothetical protein